jgi:cell division septum initiation protein DivIVA
MEQILPYQAKLVIPIRENDQRFIQIQELIDAKRELLINKQKKLCVISKQNQFLEAVKDDYQKYYGYISQQKEEQIKALEILNNYIAKLTKEGTMSNNNIKDATYEQENIMREIKSIKRNLNGIMNVVNKSKTDDIDDIDDMNEPNKMNELNKINKNKYIGKNPNIQKNIKVEQII